MKNSKVRAPIVNTNKNTHKGTLDYEIVSSTFISDQLDISRSKPNSNDLKESIPISKSKLKKLQRIRKRKKLFLQEEKVRNLLNQINCHINTMIGNNLTIADVTGKYKPISQELERLPIIHFNNGINNKLDFHPNPFSTLNSYHSTTSSKCSSTDDQEEFGESNLNLLSANDDLIQYNFCGHCKKHFVDGEAHRLTKLHQKIIESEIHWEKINELIQQIHNS